MSNKNVKNEEREVMVSHQSDLLTQDLILTGIFKHCKFKEYGLSFDFPYLRYEHGTGDISYPTWQVEELKYLNLSNDQFKRLINFLENELSLYRGYLKKFEKDIESDTNKEKMISEYFEKSFRAAATIPYFAFEMALYKKLEEEGISPKDIPSTPTDTALASLELEKITEKNSDEINILIKSPQPISQNLKNDLKEFCDRFGYLGMIYFKGHPWTTQDAYKMLFSPKLEINDDKEKKKMSKYTRFASDLLKLRTLKWETMCYGTSIFRRYIKKYFSDEIVYEKLLNLRINEVLEIINGIYPTDDKSNERYQFILEIKENGVILASQEIGPTLFKGENNIKEIKGITAQPGIIKGKAKIVLTPNEGYKVNIGDILITKMSTPDFLPVMKKASAFVTDIGGITSHAAIVSREMNKPCIIGTKIATKVLKDGMLLEVDGDSGIVRILERNK